MGEGCHQLVGRESITALRSLPPEMQPDWNRWTDDDVSLIVNPQFHISGTGYGLQTLCAGACSRSPCAARPRSLHFSRPRIAISPA